MKKWKTTGVSTRTGHICRTRKRIEQDESDLKCEVHKNCKVRLQLRWVSTGSNGYIALQYSAERTTRPQYTRMCCNIQFSQEIRQTPLVFITSQLSCRPLENCYLDRRGFLCSFIIIWVSLRMWNARRTSFIRVHHSNRHVCCLWYICLGCFLWHSLRPLHDVPGKLNAYMNILDNPVLPTIWRFYGMREFHFQYNNALCNVATTVN